MKKFTLLLMAALLMTAASSCQKDDDDDNNEHITGNDGIYNPEKKIHKCYYWDSYDEHQELREIWNWNEKRLESIDHGYESYYQDWSVSWTENFTYEGNRLVRVDNFDGLEYIEYSYSEGRLKKASYYYKYNLEAEYTFAYGNNNKLSQLSIVRYDDDKSASKGHLNSLNSFLPKEISERFNERKQHRAYGNRGTNESETCSIQFTWNGDNISNMHVEVRYEGEEDGIIYSEAETENVSFQYDSKSNPGKGFLNLYCMDGLDDAASFLNTNNMTEYTYTYEWHEYENGVLEDEGNGSGEYHFSYQYDENNYPVRMNRTRIYNDGTSSTSTCFYEYLEN